VVGRHGTGHCRLGSVADHLVRSANRSVLTVACDPDHLCSKPQQANASV
jgi:nucleotide-binding universal stress UspA family protein